METLFNYLRWSFRFILKYWVRYRVRQYTAYCTSNRHNQGNMVIAQARLMKAKLLYWQCAFSGWGYYDIGGPKNFAYSQEQILAQEKEMVWMGFTRSLRILEFKMCKQEKYPNTFTFYPKVYTMTQSGSVLRDYQE